METKKIKPGRNLIPRPKNCFMTYRMDVQHKILAERGRINNKEISKIAGQMWNSEPDTVKTYYRRKAELGKLEHKKLYPHYKYCPKKPKKPQCPKPSHQSDTNPTNDGVKPLLQGFDINQVNTPDNFIEEYHNYFDYFQPDLYFPLIPYSSSSPPFNFPPPSYPIPPPSFFPPNSPSMEELMQRYLNLEPDPTIENNSHITTTTAELLLFDSTTTAHPDYPSLSHNQLNFWPDVLVDHLTLPCYPPDFNISFLQPPPCSSHDNTIVTSTHL